MSIAEITDAIKALPPTERAQLFSSLEDLIEDYLDIQAAQDAVRENDFTPWETVKRDQDAKFNRPQP